MTRHGQKLDLLVVVDPYPAAASMAAMPGKPERPQSLTAVYLLAVHHPV
jgi:hypothetical protein